MSSSTSSSDESGKTALACISEILSSVASLANPVSATSSHSHSQVMNAHSAPLSTITNTPTKLTWFLKYAEGHLGVTSARFHEPRLREMGFGPDILHLVDDKILGEMGIKPGDIIRLKQNSQSWWNNQGETQKRKDRTPSPPAQEPPRKTVRFEKKFHSGGVARLYGPQIVAGDLDPNLDYDWYYFCEAREDWVRLPHGYVPVLDGEGDVPDY
jgi:hypothetical protein